MSLSWYLNDLQWLIHDNAYLFSTQAQQTRWINTTRRNIARKTGCIRRLLSGLSPFGLSAQPGAIIPGAMQPGSLPGSLPLAQSSQSANALMTIPGVEAYTFTGFFNPVLVAQYAGLQGIIDVGTCSVNWGSSVRPALRWFPWDEFQAYCRAYPVLNTTYPAAWSILDDGPNGSLWLYPIPSQACEFELDTYCIPADLNTDADYDAIPEGMRNAVKYGAAALSFLTSQRYAQAQVMEGLFMEAIGSARVAFDRGKTPSMYDG